MINKNQLIILVNNKKIIINDNKKKGFDFEMRSYFVIGTIEYLF